MRKSRFSETQIVAILKAHDAGTPTAELARKHGISSPITNASTGFTQRRSFKYVSGSSAALLLDAASPRRWLDVRMKGGRSTSFMTPCRTGRRIRALNIVDDFTREALAIEVDTSLCGSRVARVLHRIANERGGYPTTLVMDNGPEFVSDSLLRWAAEHDVRLHFIEPGKPTQNANIESLNARIRDEFLNEHAFLTLRDARREAALWLDHYNTIRPHGSLGYLTPFEFAQTTSQSTAHLPAA